MSLLIRKPGILSTIQDLGRNVYRRFGINPGGAMDRTAARLANILADNAEDEGLIEMHFPAAELTFECGGVAAITGGDFSAHLDERPVPNFSSFRVEPGSILKFKSRLSGNRCCLAINGGLDIKRWLGSSSTNLAAAAGGFDGRRLETNDRIGFRAKPGQTQPAVRRLAPSFISKYRPFPTVRVIAGQELIFADARNRSLIESQDFVITNKSNRMGFRLSSEPILLRTQVNLLSTAVDFGTIQLLPGGQLIILMADHQTTGGYPRIGHIVSTDLALAAQLGAGDKIAFKFVSVEQAEAISLAFERELNFLRFGCKFSKNL